MKEVYVCIGCGRNTTARCQICDKCTQMRKSCRDERGAASASGPFTELRDEFEHDYSEQSLGPHTSDERWSWWWTDDMENC